MFAQACRTTATASLLLLAATPAMWASAGPLEPRDDTTSSAISSTASHSISETTQASSQPAVSTHGSITVEPAIIVTDFHSSAAATSTNGSSDPDIATATYSGTALPTGSTVPNSTLQMCTEAKAQAGHFPPFCEPLNGTTAYTGTTYLITWWTGAFGGGTRVSAKLDFAANATQNAWHSDDIDKNMGFTYLPVDPAWLQGAGKNNLTLTLVANNPDDNDAAQILAGPTIVVSAPQATHLPAPPPTSINKLGLEIGIPVAVAVIALIMAVLFCTTRKHRTIGLGNIMGRRRKGYGIAKSRSQRMGKNTGLGVSEAEFNPTVSSFRDEPRDDIEMDSQYRDAPGASGAAGGNAFRDEVWRQQADRG